MTGNTFNAANEMTAFNGTPQTYDPNGNLANDGTKHPQLGRQKPSGGNRGIEHFQLRVRRGWSARTEND